MVLLSRSNPEGGNFHRQVRRLLPDGSPDPDFGVNYAFGKRANAIASQIFFDSRGRIVLAGTVETRSLPTGYDLAFARFLSGG